MNGTECSSLLLRIRNRHILIESKLQQIGNRVSQTACASCVKICCREEICKESIESDYLRYILGAKIKEYDNETGWYKNGQGCSLAYGRPMVCYEYFCSGIGNMHGISNLQNLASLFRKCYSKALGDRHILVLNDIQRISVDKLAKILCNLDHLHVLIEESIKRQGQLRNIFSIKLDDAY